MVPIGRKVLFDKNGFPVQELTCRKCKSKMSVAVAVCADPPDVDEDERELSRVLADGVNCYKCKETIRGTRDGLQKNLL